MTCLIATSVVRGSHQGESHGGAYLIDLGSKRSRQVLDWNKMDIDWSGRGWDRGLRGVAIDGERIYIAASDELFVFDPDFKVIGSYRNHYLRHAHEICIWERRLYVTSTGFDSILVFDLDNPGFTTGIHVETDGRRYTPRAFDPHGNDGPLMLNKLHINNVHAAPDALYISGLKTQGMLTFLGNAIGVAVELPEGIHNAQPYKDGVLFNDTRADVTRFVSRSAPERVLKVPKYPQEKLTHTNLDDSKVARQGFGRGLCLLEGERVAVGSSPSTITVHNLATGAPELVVTMSYDIRNAVHGLAHWPFAFGE